jgi:hypothetical protein
MTVTPRRQYYPPGGVNFRIGMTMPFTHPAISRNVFIFQEEISIFKTGKLSHFIPSEQA